MMNSAGLVVSALPLLCQLATAGSNDQIYADIDYGTFQTPSANVRPRFRYWPNDASVNLTQVIDDVREIGRVGAGGLELLGYYLYGDIQLFPGNYDALQSDWTVYGFGSPAWKTLLETVLTTAQEEGLLVDLALGANQGAGVPAPWDSDGLLWDLNPFEVAVPPGGSYSGVLPGWNSGPLVSASTGLIVNVVNSTDGGVNTTLSESSLIDITQSIDSNGNINITFPDLGTGTEYRIFAYYLKHSLYPEVEAQNKLVAAVPQSPITSWEQNGSWVVDHFSALGAQTTIDFWENNLLDSNTIDLIKQVGNYVWEDSQEFYLLENTFWTPNLTTAFLANRGYSVNNYVPLMINTLTSSTSVARYILDSADSGVGHIADYRQTLTELNQIYLATLSNWAKETLGQQFSAQVVYNLPMDMLANIPYVNAPECESLAFFSNVDAYRQFSGPANLAGKRVISSESGADYGQAYQLTIPTFVSDLKKSIAGSVNQFIMHGVPYSGKYGNTTWPGFTSFDYTFSEMHGRHQPGWDFYSDYVTWLSRTQWVAQTGVPKMDLAIWSKTTDYREPVSQYGYSDLQTAGYSYEYLSPDNFALPEAYVSDGVFAPQRQAFKALVVRSTDTLTGLGVDKLSEYAQAGLPIIFMGGLPSQFEGYDQEGYASANATISSLSTLQNVHVTVSGEGIAATLASLGITPRTALSNNGTWWTYWREDEVSSTDYIYVFNDATSLPLGEGATSGNITFQNTGVPYWYDTWTGDITPVLAYEQSTTTTVIPLDLAGDQTAIIAFKNNASAVALHLQSLPSSVLGLKLSSPSTLSILQGSSDDSSTCLLSNGTTITLPAVTSAPFSLANWTLIVESWTSLSDPFDLDVVATRTNLSAITDIQSLVAWSSLSPSLTNISGRGYYSTIFDWPPSSSSYYASSSSTPSGALLDLGAILHTARATLNGVPLPTFDLSHPRTDLTPYLIAGPNRLDILVSTPLGNALRPIWDTIETSGKLASATVPDPPAVAPYGLVFPVRILPVLEVAVGVGL